MDVPSRRSMACRSIVVLAAIVCCILRGVWPDAIAAQDDATSTRATFDDAISVRLATFRVRVIDPRGVPRRDLRPGDFEARVGGESIDVLAADWVAADGLPRLSAEEQQRLDAAGVTPEPEPRRVVFFVQSATERIRLVGQRRLLREVGRLLDSFGPRDELAVVSYGSRFELRVDFTGDSKRVRGAIETAAMTFGTPVDPEPSIGDASLFRLWDPVAAAEAGHPETGLRLLAEMMAQLDGERLVIFLGWGLGRFGASGVSWEADFEPAIHAFRRSRIPVHALDITDAKRHSLEAGLQSLAWNTGGSYYRAADLAPIVVRQVIANLAGYYLVSVDAERLATLRAGRRDIHLELDVDGADLSGPPLRVVR
ncbi:MAG: hypothetical protein AAGE94_20520 [Acidobacteriota bacterium]